MIFIKTISLNGLHSFDLGDQDLVYGFRVQIIPFPGYLLDGANSNNHPVICFEKMDEN